MTGYAGSFGASVIAEKKEEELKKRFPAFLIRQAKSFAKDGFERKAAEIFTGREEEFGIEFIRSLSEGGVFKGLWELGEEAGTGFGVELKKVPVKQETIEICNQVDINPYELMSNGAELILCNDPVAVEEELKNHGMNASVIGRTHPEKKRVIYYDDEERFIEPRRGDSIWEIPEVLPAFIKE